MKKCSSAAKAALKVRRVFGGIAKMVVAIAAFAVAGAAWAVPENLLKHETVGGITWTYYPVGGNALLFNNYDAVIATSTSGAITIPSSLGGYPVSEIDDSAFKGCTKLTDVTVPDSVTKIESGAFYGCSNLAKLSIPNSVTTMGTGIADFCTSLEKVKIPAQFLNSKSYLFYKDTKSSTDNLEIKSYTITSDPVLMKCVRSKYGKVTIGYDNSDRTSPAIDANTSGSVTVPNTANFFGAEYPVTMIDEGAFAGCNKMKTVTLPNTVKEIGGGAFNGCSSMTSINVPTQLQRIGDLAFWNCSSLSRMVLNDSVESIGVGAFQSCTSLSVFTFGAGTREIGERVLNNCTRLNIVNFVTNGKDIRLTIPKGAFKGCTSLAKIKLPDTVYEIKDAAFEGCTQLTSVMLPEWFSTGSLRITDVADIFPGCPTSLMEIVFRTTGDLKISNINNTYWYYSLFNGIAKLVPNGPSSLAAYPTPTGVLKLPSRLGGYWDSKNIEIIEASAFKGCSGITKLIIPEGVKQIGSYAFQNCTGLTEVVLPSTVTSIGQYAFDGCNKLTSLELPNGITSAATGLENNAFGRCTQLANVVAPGSLYAEISSSYNTFVGRVFPGCSNLATFTFRYEDHLRQSVGGVFWRFVVDNGEAEIVDMDSASGKMTVPATLGGYPVTSIGSGAFAFSDITEIDIPNSGNVTNIGSDAFSNCSKLTKVTISTKVTGIGANAFSNCPYLETVTLPQKITKVAGAVFYGCQRLRRVYTDNFKVDEVGDYAFFGCSALIGRASESDPLNGTIGGTIASATKIGTYAFACQSLTIRPGTLYVPDSVTSIGDYAFSYSAFEGGVSLPGRFLGKIDESKMFYGCPTTMRITYRLEDGVYAAKVGNITWLYTLDSAGNATLAGTTLTSTYSGSLPISIEGHPVVAIAPDAFKDNEYFHFLTIPGSIKTIGSGAFRRTKSSVKELYLTIVNGVETIGANAFEGVPAFTDSNETFVVPDSVTSIGSQAFKNCSRQYRISLPGHFYNVITIDSSVFEDHPSGFVLTYRRSDGDLSATKYGGATWYFKDSETAGFVTIYSVSSSGTAVTPKPTGALTIPSKLGGKKVDTIGSYAFKGCTGITSVTIPSSVKTIKAYAFDGCTGLTSVSIPRTVTAIEDYAFIRCSNLASADLPDTLSGKINQANVFLSCASGISVVYRDPAGRTSVTVGGNTWWYRVVDGGAELFFSDDQYASHQAVTPKPTGALVIPDTLNGYPVTKIGKWAFSTWDGNGDYYYGMTSVTIPASVTEIDEYAFEHCRGLKSVTFKSGSALATIRKRAFQYCSSLTGIVLPDSLTTIEIMAFADCSALTSVTIPEGVVEIQEGAFSYTTIEQVTIPESVASLGSYVFSYCTNMTSVVIPASLTDVGYGAFNGCKKLEDVTLGSQAIINKFRDVFDLRLVKRVTFESGVTNIPVNAFYDSMVDYDYERAALESVDLSDTLETFYFKECPNLQSLDIPEGVKSGKAENCLGLTRLSIPASLALDENSSFRGLNKLQELVLAEGIKTIGDDMFKYAFDLPSLVIPDGVTSIGARAFYRAESLATLTIPNSVESIGDEAFAQAGLATVHVAARDTARVKAMLVASGLEESFVNGLTFVEELPAHWFITFNGNGGTVSEAQYNIAPNENLGTLPTATRANYGFLGWFTEAEGGSQISATTKATGDVTYYAHWSLKQYTVTVDTGTGSPVPVIVTHGTTIGDVLEGITQPTREGYTFKGWVDADDEPLDLFAPVTADTTFIAVWAKNITLDCRAVVDGELQPKSYWNKSLNGVEGDELDLPAQTLEGYVFLGWSTDPDGELLTGSIVATEGLVLYAQFTLDAWTVTFDPNGGECGTTSVKVEKGGKLDSLPEAIYPGYKFKGWFTAAIGGEKVEANVTAITGDTTYYAQWALIAVDFTIVDGVLTAVELNGVKDVVIPDTVTAIAAEVFRNRDITSVVIPDSVTAIGEAAFGNCYKLVSVTIPGTVVDMGDYVLSNCDMLQEVIFSEGCTSVGKFMFYNCMSLRAVTLPRSIETIGQNAFDWNDAIWPTFDGVVTVKVAYGDTARISALWEYAWRCVMPHEFEEMSAVPCTVSFDAQGGTPAPEDATYIVGDAFGTLPSVTKTDYKFKGWFTAATGGEQVTEATLVTGDTTLYAQWTTIPQHTVTFDVNGGTLASGSASITVTEGQKVGTQLPVATRDGYGFLGWGRDREPQLHGAVAGEHVCRHVRRERRNHWRGGVHDLRCLLRRHLQPSDSGRQGWLDIRRLVHR